MVEQETSVPSEQAVPAQKSIYIDEVQGREQRLDKLVGFTYSSTRAAAVMLLAAIVALIVANTAAYEPFVEFWETEFGFILGEHHAAMSLAEIINDIFMAVFFLMVGLEIKYEMTAGELTNIRQALLPILGACGGVCAPIVIYTVFNMGFPESAHGWGVPTATDIAFALGIMALLGNRVPNGVRVFLSTLAVADDIIAIIIIAVFYGQTPSAFWLACAAAVIVILAILNKCRIYALAPYLLIGVVLWYCVFRSGIHSTIAGVALAFTIPIGSRVKLHDFTRWSGRVIQKADNEFAPEIPVQAQEDYIHTVARLSQVAKQVVPPATRLEHMLYPWVNFGILPLFALTNADVSFAGGDLGAMVTSPVFYGVFFGLLLGKPIGIMLFSFITVKTKLASLPENVTWIHMLGAGILGGVGFTMAIFVANLAFEDPTLITNAKVAILSASLTAGILGFIFLLIQAKRDKAKGLVYLTAKSGEAETTSASDEAARKSEDLLAAIDSPLVHAEIEAAIQEHGGSAEIVVNLGKDGVRSDDLEHAGPTEEDNLPPE